MSQPTCLSTCLSGTEERSLKMPSNPKRMVVRDTGSMHEIANDYSLLFRAGG